jgi:hypothetical protein
MKKNALLLLIAVFTLAGCEDFLDRPAKTQMNDQNYWTSENNVRMFTNGFYENYFTGYNTSYGTAYTPRRGYTFNDDLTSRGKQAIFESQTPASRYAMSESLSWLSQYAGPTWNFAWVRKANFLLERADRMKDGILTEEEYQHWSAVARFFRGAEYSRLVSVFGDVPYYNHVVPDTDLDELYKDRTERSVVMDAVYDDFEYVLDNMRENDGAQYVNRYIAASFISRFMLFEGTWQKYHMNNSAKAQKYLEQAIEAAGYVMSSGVYSFGSDFRSLFGSQSLAGNPEVIMHRTYDAALGVTHCLASYSNLQEGHNPGPNLSLAKSFICTDGQPYQLSGVDDADKQDITSLVYSRDPRFEATFWDTPKKESATMLYACKFIDREGVKFYGGTYPAEYGSNTNTNDAPVIRLAEVVLNWIEAKAELATLGGAAVSQSDINESINAIRNRPLDEVAVAKGIQKTAPLLLSALPDDPERDADVPALIWEIRRERRMEFVYEHTRLLDIKRWKKIDYMNGKTNPDIMRGIWVDFPNEFSEWLVPEKSGLLQVEHADGTIVTYDGTNDADMVGYYIPEDIQHRDDFTDKVYMSPVGNTQINEYKDKGYTLTQTTGWD